MKILFNINYEKALEVVLWILDKRDGVNIYNLLKILFHAESLSVNKIGRPITGDNYIAMNFGTVPDVIYKGLICKDPIYLESFNLTEVPFTTENKYFLYPTRKADEDYLSESDKIFLEEGMKEYIDLSFEEVKNKNHSNVAWQKTYYDKSPNTVIDWYDIITDPQVREDLLGVSRYTVI